MSMCETRLGPSFYSCDDALWGVASRLLWASQMGCFLSALCLVCDWVAVLFLEIATKAPEVT